ncbi:phospholipase A2 family protein [Streptococcus ovis]|uniref:phospholipase A2 family protein n=1 Tax=Streptococcus ovis TaxID=82806 RepID=UPI000360B18F|nr:phospholipase A2 family protein [Streptococcus ovis]
MLIAFSLFLFTLISYSTVIQANELDSELPVEFQEIFLELDRVTEYDEGGNVYINLKEAHNQGLSQETLVVGDAITDLSMTVKTEGTGVAFRRVFFGFYGNYCGKGNKGWNIPPKDDLDYACMRHDMCFTGSFSKNDSCNREFLKRLLPIIQTTPALSSKGAVAIAAYRLFSL